MKKIAYQLLLTVLLVGIFTAGCSDATGPEGGGGSQSTEAYFGTTSEGHILSLQIDSANEDYSFYNETTGNTISGTFNVSTNPNYAGTYITSNDHFIIEVPEEIIITSIPLGGKAFGLSFGISSERDLNDENLLGNYIFIRYDSDGLDAYGGFAINAGGTYTYGLAPDEVTSPFNYFQGDGSGTWNVSPDDSSRITFVEGVYTATGTILPGKLLLLNDTAGGYNIGIKYPSSPVSFGEIAGTYTCIDYLEDGDVGIGHYQLPSSSAPISWYIDYQNYGVDSGTSTDNLERHPYINNLFTIMEGDWYTSMLLLPGDVILHNCAEWDGSDWNIVSTGIGARI